MRSAGTFKILANRDIREAVKQTTVPTTQSEDLESRSTASVEPPRKKRKHNADLVTYTRETVPPELLKYWNQRHKLFSRFDEGIQMDKEGWWSVTPEDIAAQIAERCRCDIIVDGFCGVGGNAIQFALTCERVIAIDISPTRLACARHNAALYGVEDRIEFICADFTAWIRSLPSSTRSTIDVIFLSPPWGGVDYLSSTPSTPIVSSAKRKKPIGPYLAGDRVPEAAYDLGKLQPIPGRGLFDLARTVTKNVAIFLPRSTDTIELASWASPDELVEVEQEWVGEKLKAVTAYYGELAKEPSEEEMLVEVGVVSI